MQIEHVTEYRGFLVRSLVTFMEGGRYAAAAIVADRTGEARTLGVDGDFAEADEARDQATELAMAWIDRRNVVSDHYVRRA
ncbi:hypothetical protein DID96_29595 [Burkholderia sp. Bp8963]|uniref:hypothetical protein n=1 Tax=Burkholderia sp. Bp8963 TaxID=2184547 RepID=UPI000F5AA617|nr:hypothetical protein [Burkholderia sp. Bp8963]RQS63553.1 hypothetical protein DID96_29595 [Burkholderia sp. Bp8963]